jgi:hypothetical protein
MKAYVNKSTLRAAYCIAILADMLEIGLWPVFSEGFASILDDIVDVIVCIVLTLLVGWHVAFIPSFLIKFVPGVDLAPTWTIALLIATRNRTFGEKNITPTASPEPGMKRIEDAAPKPPIIPPGN